MCVVVIAQLFLKQSTKQGCNLGTEVITDLETSFRKQSRNRKSREKTG
jgi:hypothetical protein